MTVIPRTQQRVFVDALKSDYMEITKRVPQGSILAPHLADV